MSNPNCPNCGQEMKYVKEGISKRTGKPYSAFWSCLDKECGGTSRAEKPQEFKKAIPSLITTEELDHKLGIIRGDILKVQNKLEAMEKVLNNIEAQIIAKSIKWISGD